MAALTGFTTSERIIRHAHVFCGVGAGAKGFNMAKARVGNVAAKFLCTGGIDVDPGAIRNFERLTGCPGTVMDLFDRGQFTAFHGREPGEGWREQTPADVRAALVGADGIRPDVIFLSAPCKGFSGLLSSKQSGTDKYQALNGLTLRGVWLICEAFKDGPIPVILFENVPRILTRGRGLLDQIAAILRGYGYNVAETVHDCGELGSLAQSRKRMLLIARQREIIPNFIYEPEKKRLRGVGEVIGKLPLPGDPVAGIMHRVPMLQWKTWMRLALVPAGRDWRALNELEVVDGILRDYGVVPEQALRDGVLGVMGWGETAGTVIGNQRSPLHGRHSVADPRPQQSNQTYHQYGVRGWAEPAGTVTGQSAPGGGPNSIADPRLGRVAHSNVYRITRFDTPATAVTSSRDTAVADPRGTASDYTSTKYMITPWEGQSRTVIGASTTGDGAFAVADPRPTHGPNAHQNKMKVVSADEPAPTITGSDRVGSGALSVADPRPLAFREGREHYVTGGHYGVVGWHDTALTVSGSASYDNGRNSVADPREIEASGETYPLPAPDDRLVARIIALDGTWHRPFTTLDLAALQSIVDPEDVFYRDADGWHARMPFELDSKSDSEKREWIGNAVPSESAAEIGSVIGEAILLADLGETFSLSTKAIWVSPARVALAVEQQQAALQWEAGAA